MNLSPATPTTNIMIRPIWSLFVQRFCLSLVLTSTAIWAQEEIPTKIDSVDPLTDGRIRLRITAPRNHDYQVQVSQDLNTWQTTSTTGNRRGNFTYESDDSNPTHQFYRVVQLAEPAPLTGDHIPTTVGDLIVHPVNHGSFVMWWNHLSLYVDPVGGGSLYQAFQAPDFVFITHPHGDHFDASTLRSIVTESTKIIAPEVVVAQLPSSLKEQVVTLHNGDHMESEGIEIESVPAYNLSAGRLNFHPKGIGNSYLLTIDNRRIYFSGDTEDIPEMRALENVDVAFLCMNLPFTMTEDQAADATLEFRPKIVYPYHHRGSDTKKFKTTVAQDPSIQVRLRNWY